MIKLAPLSSGKQAPPPLATWSNALERLVVASSISAIVVLIRVRVYVSASCCSSGPRSLLPTVTRVPVSLCCSLGSIHSPLKAAHVQGQAAHDPALAACTSETRAVPLSLQHTQLNSSP